MIMIICKLLSHHEIIFICFFFFLRGMQIIVYLSNFQGYLAEAENRSLNPNTSISRQRKQQPASTLADKLISSQRTSATSLLSHGSTSNPRVHTLKKKRAMNKRSSCTRELLGSSSLTESGRQSLEELAELRFGDCKLEGREVELTKILQILMSDEVAEALRENHLFVVPDTVRESFVKGLNSLW